MEISAFRGIRYNESVVGDAARNICPPYDVITPEQQSLYHKRSDYNAIRLEFPEPTAGKYERAAIAFQEWLSQGVLQLDSVPGFYLHDHQFEYLDKRMVRRGVIARVRLEAWGRGIFPHEETASRDKSDRLQLMRACRASFSPLLSLYHDSQQRIAAILSHVARREPLMSLQLERGNLPDSDEAHTLWVATDPQIKRELTELLSAESIYVADGHHRYETALTYREERTQQQPSGNEETVRHVMMELVDFSDPGLVVLPVHRLVRGLAPSDLSGLGDQLGNLFIVESVPLETQEWALPAGSCLGILGLQPDSVVVLRRRQDVSLEALMPTDRCQAYREFGVSIFNHIILERILRGAKDLDIGYSIDLKEAHKQIREGKYQLAFLSRGPDPETVKSIAKARDRLPRKSTYFYPKVPAGIVVNPLY